MYPEAFFKMHDVTDDLVKKRKESKTHFGDFVDKIIEVCNDANSPVTEDMIKSQGNFPGKPLWFAIHEVKGFFNVP